MTVQLPMTTSPSTDPSNNLSPVTYQEIRNCDFSEWSTIFRGYTIQNRMITIEDARMIKYLKQSERLIIPEFLVKGGDGTSYTDPISQLSDDDEVESEPIRTTTSNIRSELESISSAFNTMELNSSDDEDSEKEDFEFLKEFNVKVQSLIAELGGEVVPKLNWSAPKDAIWIAPTKSLKCHDLGDILLLLKASDDIAHDLHRAYRGCLEVIHPPPPITLVLKRWCDIEPAREFRCFILHNKLVGVSQRDTNHYEFLWDDLLWLRPKVTNFINQVVMPKFKSTHYTVDVYVTINHVVKIIDFNPASPITHPLLFTWSELLQLTHQDNNLPVWRIIQDTHHSNQAQSHRLNSNRIPTDFIRPTSETRDIIQKIASLT